MFFSGCRWDFTPRIGSMHPHFLIRTTPDSMENVTTCAGMVTVTLLKQRSAATTIRAAERSTISLH